MAWSRMQGPEDSLVDGQIVGAPVADKAFHTTWWDLGLKRSTRPATRADPSTSKLVISYSSAPP
jgi:hypothetical protein